MRKKWIQENIRELGPALAILLATLAVSTFFTEFTFAFGWNALWKTFLRFLRLSLILTLPLLLLPGLCSVLHRFLNRGTHQLIQVEKDCDLAIHPLKNWLLRPFQGLGLVMLIAVKLLAFLEIYTGHPIAANAILPPGHFDPQYDLCPLLVGGGMSAFGHLFIRWLSCLIGSRPLAPLVACRNA